MNHAETLFSAQQVTTAAVNKQSKWPEWGCYNAITAELEVTAAAAGAGDTLVVKIQHRIGTNWYDLITFTTVAGTASVPNREVKSLTKDANNSWFNAIRALATPAGAGANFTFNLRIQGST